MRRRRQRYLNVYSRWLWLTVTGHIYTHHPRRVGMAHRPDNIHGLGILHAHVENWPVADCHLGRSTVCSSPNIHAVLTEAVSANSDRTTSSASSTLMFILLWERCWLDSPVTWLATMVHSNSSREKYILRSSTTPLCVSSTPLLELSVSRLHTSPPRSSISGGTPFG